MLDIIYLFVCNNQTDLPNHDFNRIYKMVKLIKLR